MRCKTVTVLLRIRVRGHCVISITKNHESQYVTVLDNPLPQRCNPSQEISWIRPSLYLSVLYQTTKPAILASHISHDLTTYYTDLGVLPIYCINKCQNIVAVKRNSNPQPFKFKFLRLQCASNEKGILKQLVAIARIRETTVKDFFECQLYFKNLKRPFNKTPR